MSRLMPVLAVLLAWCLLHQPAAAHRHLQQEQEAATPDPAAAATTAADATAPAGLDGTTVAPTTAEPVEASAAAVVPEPAFGDPERFPPPGGRLGWEIPDRTPGPPHLDPSGQGKYMGFYRWVWLGQETLQIGWLWWTG